MSTEWKKIHVFISSTFNDMHAERDYLVKQVFPELREWCEKRKLRLVDIDLRWGVTEQDALHNKNVVKVCLDRIDDCRPFFLCFLGQRRGWVPGEGDISSATYEEFPGLKEYAGNTSVTEMEILHALVDPLHRGTIRDPKKPAESYDPAKYAFFYLRDGSYLDKLPSDPPLLRQTYTNEGIEDEKERAQQDAQLKQWREEKIPATGRSFRPYQATWDSHLSTPELLLPMQCPSSDPTSLKRWQEQWAKAGVNVTGNDLEKDSAEAEKARTINNKLISGRLTEFQSEKQPLSLVILHDLQEAILKRYPDHVEVGKQGDLQKEIDQQEQFLYSGSEGFISRGDDFKELDAYVDSNEKKLFVLSAASGMGKSTLLATWIDHARVKIEGKPGQSIHFRFIGQSDQSTTVYSLLQFLMRELKESTHKLTDIIPDDPQKLRQDLPKLLEAVGKKGKTVIVLDALNQLESGLSDLAWLPYQLPENIKLVVSFKRGEPAAEDLLKRLQGQAILAEIKPFTNLDDRRKLVKVYLAQYLKDLDKSHLETLISSDGADNPLFLKVVLSELRIFGAFANLGEKIRLDFGDSPISAFQGVLKRLENDPAYSPIDPHQAVPLMFGLLAHTRQGLQENELVPLLSEQFGASPEAARSTVRLYLRQARSFLALRDSCYDFFYDSFKIAIKERYGMGAPGTPWNAILEAFYAAQPLSFPTQAGGSPNRRKLSELPYHQVMAGSNDTLQQTWSDFQFIRLGIQGFGLYRFIDDFAVMELPGARVDYNIKATLYLIRDALQLSAHVISQDETQLAGQVIGRLQEIDDPAIVHLRELACQGRGSAPWLRPLKVHFSSTPGNALLFTLQGEVGAGDISVSPDGRYALTISQPVDMNANSNRYHSRIPAPWEMRRKVRVWDLRAQARLREYSDIANAVVTPDGRYAVLFADSHDGEGHAVLKGFRLDLTTLVESDPAFLKIDRGDLVVGITPDGQRAISTTRSGSVIKVWDVSTGIEKKALYLPGQVENLSALPGNKMLVNNGLWDIAQGGLVVEFWSRDTHVSRNGKLIAQDQGMQGGKSFGIWDLENAQRAPMKRFSLSYGSMFKGYIFSPSGQQMIYADDKGAIQVKDTSTGMLLSQFNTSIPVQTSAIDAFMAVSPDEKVLIYSYYGNCNAYDLGTGKILFSFKNPGRVIDMAVLPDGNEVWLYTEGKEDEKGSGTFLKAYSLMSGQEIFCQKIGIGQIPRSFTPDRTKVLFAIPTTEDGNEVDSKRSSSWCIRFILWDMANKKQITSNDKVITKYRTDNSTNRISFTISPDGNRIFIGSQLSKGIEVYDTSTNQMVRTIPMNGLSGISALAVSPDGRELITASDDYTLNTWDLPASTVLPGLHSRMYERLVFSPDGSCCAMHSPDGTLTSWDLAAARERFSLSASAIFFGFSEDGKILLYLSRDQAYNHSTTMVNAVNGVEIASGKNVDDRSSYSYAMSWDGAGIIFAGGLNRPDDNDKLLVVESARGGGGVEFATSSLKGKKLSVFSQSNFYYTQPVVTPDGQFLVTHSNLARQLDVWDLASGKRVNTLTAFDNVKALAVAQAGHILVSGSETQLQVWDTRRLQPDAKQESTNDGRLIEILFTRDRKKAASGSNMGHLHIWDLSTQEKIHSMNMLGEFQQLAISKDDQRLVCFSRFQFAGWNIDSGEEIVNLTYRDRAALSEDAHFAVIGKKETNTYQLDLLEFLPGGKYQIQVLIKDAPGKIDGMAITSDGARLLWKTYDNENNQHSFVIYDIRKAKIIQNKTYKRSIDRFLVIPGERFAATSTQEDGITIWDIERGKEKWSSRGGLRSLIIAPDGRKLIIVPSNSSTQEKKPRLPQVWDIEKGKPLLTLDRGWNIDFVGTNKTGLPFFDDWDRNGFHDLIILDPETFQDRLVLQKKYNQYSKAVSSDLHYFARAASLKGDETIGKYLFEEDMRIIQVIDLVSGQEISSFYLDTEITKIEFAPDNRTLLAGDMLGQVHFLRLEM